MAECRSCGAAIDRRDAFCAKCGELTERGQPVAQKIGPVVGALSTEFGKFLSWIIDYVSAEARRKQVIAGGATIALLLVALTDNPISAGISSLFSEDVNSPQLTEEGLPDFASYEDVFIGDEEEFIVIGTANVRDFPTSQGTTVKSTFSGGETVFAREVKTFDQSSRWFKLISGGYLWGGNLRQASTSPEATQVSFPTELQGEWTDVSQCEGSQYPFTIRFEDNQYSELGRSGTLLDTSQGIDGSSVFRLEMKETRGDQYAGAISVQFNAQRTAILVDDLNMEVDVPRWWYRINSPCSQRNEAPPSGS